MKFCVLLFVLLLALSAHAQFGAMPRTSTIRTPYGNQTITTYQQTPMYYYGHRQASVKHKFTIMFKGDSSLTANTRIDISDKQHTLRIKTAAGKKTVLPSNTKELYRVTATGKKLTGIPADTCWLFKVAEGRINGYSHLAEEGYEYVIAIQDGSDSPIIPLTRKNLEVMTGETSDSKLKKLIDKNNLTAAVALYNKSNP